jgi:hypothetical protein
MPKWLIAILSWGGSGVALAFANLTHQALADSQTAKLTAVTT